MLERLNKALDRIESRFALWSIIGGTSFMGIATGWFAKGVDLISQFGFFGWWIAGICGALLTALCILALAWARYAWIHARARQRWMERVDSFNPLDKSFENIRVKISDLSSPIDRTIRRKRISECELLGPANIFIFHDAEVIKNEFIECAFIVLWPDVKGFVYPGDAIKLTETVVRECKIYEATIMVSPDLVPTLHSQGVTFSTLTGDTKIDSLKRPGIG